MLITRSAVLVVLPLCLLALPAFAANETAYVKITAPADGATLDGFEPGKLVYDVRPGPKGDHVHVYVDEEEVGILRQLAGSYSLGPLPPGTPTLCVKVVNKAHVPIGVEQCVKVNVE